MFSKKNILILILRNMAISFFAIFIALSAIIFISSKINTLSDSVTLNKKLEAELENRTTLLKTLESDTALIGTNDILIENAFPPSDNILVFINSLDNLASRNSLIETYRFESPIPTTTTTFPLSTILYSNTFKTNIKNFSIYLKEFNKLPYFTNIESFNISSQDALGFFGESNVIFHAKLYTKNTQ